MRFIRRGACNDDHGVHPLWRCYTWLKRNLFCHIMRPLWSFLVPCSLIEQGSHVMGRRYPYHVPDEGYVPTNPKSSCNITFLTPLDCCLVNDALEGLQPKRCNSIPSCSNKPVLMAL